eukprot:m51a1_g4731 hypothetical protein (417) ;mRNA; r:352691-354236
MAGLPEPPADLTYCVELPVYRPEAWEAAADALRGLQATPEGLDALWSALGVPHRAFFSRRAGHAGLDVGALCRAAPALRDLALEMPALFGRPLAVLPPRRSGEVRISRRQAACLVLHSLLGLMPPRNMELDNFGGFNAFNASELLRLQNPAAAACLFNYLTVVALDGFAEGDLVYRRVYVAREEVPALEDSVAELCAVRFDSSTPIERSPSALHADFANAFIGGGALHGGNVQEEILFAIKPELLVAMALCPQMTPTESIVVAGALQYSDYTGYGSRFAYAGRHASDADARARPADVAALDAVVALHVPQFAESAIRRDAVKAYVAFQRSEDETVATGNWGCGVFGGNHLLKLCQQWVGASAAGIREMHYCTFGDQRAVALPRCAESLRQRYRTAGALFQAVLQHKDCWDDFADSL